MEGQGPPNAYIEGAIAPCSAAPDLNNRTWLNGLLTIGEHHNFLEEGKIIVGGASVAFVVSHCYPIFMVFGIMKEYYSRRPVLPDTLMYSTFS